MKRYLLLFTALAAFIPVSVFAASSPVFSFEFMTGTALNFPTPLTVQQTGFPDIRLTAEYDTKPFGPSIPYYSWRAALWDKEGAWEIGQVHHRIFLKNPPLEIEYFAVHFGYNFFYAGRSWRWEDYLFHLECGPLITNPETSVRGMVLNTSGTFIDGGYYLSGLGFSTVLSRNFYLTKDIYLAGEIALLAGFAWWVPVANGSADVPTLGLHGRLGVGFSL